MGRSLAHRLGPVNAWIAEEQERRRSRPESQGWVDILRNEQRSGTFTLHTSYVWQANVSPVPPCASRIRDDEDEHEV